MGLYRVGGLGLKGSYGVMKGLGFRAYKVLLGYIRFRFWGL